MNVIKKNLIAGAISMIGKDNISDMINNLVSGILQKKSEVQLLPGENYICGLFYEVNGEIHYSTVAIREGENQEMNITRFMHVQKISDLIDKAIKEID